MKRHVSSIALGAGLGMCLAGAAMADIIDNGLVQLGINDEGNLVQSGIGLNFLPTSGEALAPGCPCEGWGIADLTTGAFGMAGETFGDANINSATLTTTGTGTDALSTGDASVSEVSVIDGDFQVDVTHEFTPSASDNLYQVDVTMTNVGSDDIGDLVYPARDGLGRAADRIQRIRHDPGVARRQADLVQRRRLCHGQSQRASDHARRGCGA